MTTRSSHWLGQNTGPAKEERSAVPCRQAVYFVPGSLHHPEGTIPTFYMYDACIAEVKSESKHKK